MKQNIRLLFLLFILFLGTSFRDTRIKTGFIKEGVSADKIAIGMSFKEADMLLDDRYRRIKWRKYSYEYKYKNTGISIYVLQADTSKTIFAIDVDVNTWHGVTQKGLEVNKELKVKNVISIYGKPEWRVLEHTKEASLIYDSLGIYFSTPFKEYKSFDKTANNDSIFADYKIESITLGKPGTSY